MALAPSASPVQSAGMVYQTISSHMTSHSTVSNVNLKYFYSVHTRPQCYSSVLETSQIRSINVHLTFDIWCPKKTTCLTNTDVTCLGYGVRRTSATCRTSDDSVSGMSRSGSVQPPASGRMGRTVLASWRHIGHQNSLCPATRPCTAWPYNDNINNQKALSCGRTDQYGNTLADHNSLGGSYLSTISNSGQLFSHDWSSHSQ